MSEISWLVWVFWLVFCFVVWGMSPLKKWFNFDGLSRHELLGCTSPWNELFPRLVIHMKHSYTCLAKYLHSSSLIKQKFSCSVDISLSSFFCGWLLLETAFKFTHWSARILVWVDKLLQDSLFLIKGISTW